MRAKRKPAKTKGRGTVIVRKVGRKYVMAKKETKDNDKEAKVKQSEHGSLIDAPEAQATETPITPLDVGPLGVRPEGHEGPTVVGLQPDTAVCGDNTDIRLYVVGTGYTKDSVITFNGLDEPTTFHDQHRVSTGVKPSLFVVPAVCPVGVRSPGFAASNTMDFTFTEKEAAPEGGA